MAPFYKVAPLVGALGIAQIISWGTLFYAIGVLGPAIRQELAVSEVFLFGSFTAGLLISGALSPFAGRMIDARGGRVVLCVGSLLGAAAMLLLASSRHPAVMAFGWLVAGAAMAASLYEPAFATLSQHTGPRYREAVSALTLFGGFASTVFWPISQLCLESFGWRETFVIYAALHVLVCLPLHWIAVPRHQPSTAAPAAAAGTGDEAPERRRTLRWLAASLAIATFVFTTFAVHIIGLLTTAGLTAAQAVTVSMLFGPMQVAGRIIDMSFARRIKGVTTGFFSFALMVLALLAMMAVDGFGVAAFAFVIAYGIGNGVLTIVRGTVPAELFGREGLGALLGYVSRATLVARALSPAALSALFAFGLTRNQALALLVGVSLAGAGCYVAAVRSARPPGP